MPLRIPSALLSLALIGWAAPAAAQQEGVAAADARLGLLTRVDRELLAPQLEHGPVALVEFSGEAELPAIIFAARVRAPAATVARVIADPTAYPRFMPALDSVDVQSRRDSSIAYEWTWRTTIFTLRGSNVMTIYPGPGQRRDRPYRIESRSTGGDLGTGRLTWRVYPDGPDRSLLVLSSRLDLRNANYVTRQISQGGRSINRTINLSLALIMVLGTSREAERVAGAPPVTEGPGHPLERPQVDVRALAPMMSRGDLLFLHMTGDRLDQVAIVGRPGQSLERVREVMTDPREFGPALVPGSYARVTSEENGEVDFDWGVDIPLVGTSGTMRLNDTGSVVMIEAVGGALTGGRWRFDTELLPWNEPVVLGWADFDPATAGWLIRALVQGNPEFGFGIAAGSQVMLLRAIRSRAWRRHEQRAATEARSGGG